jgi:hypothetical protein
MQAELTSSDYNLRILDELEAKMATSRRGRDKFLAKNAGKQKA